MLCKIKVIITYQYLKTEEMKQVLHAYKAYFCLATPFSLSPPTLADRDDPEKLQ
jgi:hypothetical protein